MSTINTGDYVEIVRTANDQQNLLHKRGRVAMIIDNVKFVLLLDEGGYASVTADQVKQVN